MNDDVNTRRTRRLPGGGRKSPFIELEQNLISWVRARNSKCLRVKDQYIRLKAVQLYREQILAAIGSGFNSDNQRVEFAASAGWCSRFKKRYEILMDYCKNNILSRRETAFSREPTLLIIDSYGEHVKLLKENKLAKYNVFVVTVPPNLTGVLQPLDVAINRSYQRFHDSLYDQYIAEALENPELQTKAGNPKVPDYRRVSDWVVEWMDTKTSAEIIKAFQVCGLVPRPRFDLDQLHPPLKDLFSADYNMEDWNEKYSELCDNEDASRLVINITAAEWFMPLDESGFSFFCCVLYMKDRSQHDLEGALNAYITEVVSYMSALPDIEGLHDDDHGDALMNRSVEPSDIEIFTVSSLEKWNIKVTTLNHDCLVMSEFEYTVEEAVKSVHIVNMDSYYAIKIV
ncbi:hypothetical protein R1sor_022981 [Riccia sorocarpa]|uniref:HTH CENPB-type domain-containing protein n=1 Tax=Riccia sorocarpa TaxID=122646 RepID=A0ABD3GLE1_9MARC